MDGTATNSSVTGEESDSDSGLPDIACEPGEVRCNGQGFIETCLPTGLDWMSEPCGLNRWCEPCGDDDTCAQDRCIGECDVEADLPSSSGCSFVTTRGLHIAPDNPDGLVVANPNTELTAVVQLYHTPEGKRKEEPVGDPIVLEPLDDYLFEINTNFVLGDSSMFRTGGVHRVESDAPIVAYLHGPLSIDAGNDSSLLLPEVTARRHYVAFSYFPNSQGNQGDGEPSWFEIVALHDFTTVIWTPTVNTAGNNLNIDFVEAGATSGPLPMNRFDTARIAASAIDMEEPDLRDLAGTVIEADKPILVWSGNRCARVPMRPDWDNPGRCDPLQELLIPIDYWGNRYVAAASPQRGSERHYWRVFSGYDEVTITTEPQVLTEELCTDTGTMDSTWTGEGCTLARRGSFFEVDVPQGTNFLIQGTAPAGRPEAFMPVQFLQSAHLAPEPVEQSTELGDPAMVQTIPVEQYLSRYVFSTGVGYPLNYVQVVRELGGPAVYLDNGDATFTIADSEFVAVGRTHEVANVLIDEGTYVIESGASFGITQMGWTTPQQNPSCTPANPNPGEQNVCFSAYAYPGGMKPEPLYVP